MRGEEVVPNAVGAKYEDVTRLYVVALHDGKSRVIATLPERERSIEAMLLAAAFMLDNQVETSLTQPEVTDVADRGRGYFVFDELCK